VASKAAGPRFFATSRAFRAWLEKHHRTAQELVVGFYKKETGVPSITWPESVDQALCFGWIDGIRRRLDDERYSIRFTPRRPGSTWSAINITRVAELEATGQMRPAGREAFARRSDAKSRTYSYEQREQAKLEPEHQELFETRGGAWAFFRSQAPSYQRLAIYWVASAQKPETRLRRLRSLIDASRKRRRLY
jgi:uncharacterized protein YdeI (YjbR/CyaY-like superfamily)